MHRSFIITALLAVALLIPASALAKDKPAPPSVLPGFTGTVEQTPIPTTSGPTTSVACGGQCFGGGYVVAGCWTVSAHGGSYLNSWFAGGSMDLAFSYCHNQYAVITDVWGAHQECNAWGTVQSRNGYLYQSGGGRGANYVSYHSHCEFGAGIGGAGIFWEGHDLDVTGDGWY